MTDFMAWEPGGGGGDHELYNHFAVYGLSGRETKKGEAFGPGGNWWEGPPVPSPPERVETDKVEDNGSGVYHGHRFRKQKA